MKKLNGFNNGRDTTEGVGGKEPYYKINETKMDIEKLREENETPFKGSQLETEIRNTNDFEKLKTVHRLVKGGFENQPHSIFWKEAFEMIDKKIQHGKTI